MQETLVWSLGWEDPLEEVMATHSSILAWRIPVDKGSWQATVHGVSKSQTWLSEPGIMVQNLLLPANHDGVITYLQPDILECEVKWALGGITTNKANGGNRIPAELFQILKHDAVEVLHSICQSICKTQLLPQDWKGQFSFQPKKGNAKECSNSCTIVFISHASKIMLKIVQARLQQSQSTFPQVPY